MTQQKARYEWFQTDLSVTVAIYIKQVDKKDVEVVFSPKTLSISIKLSSGSTWNLEIDPLLQEVLPMECNYSILSTQVQIKLVKKVPGIKWDSLEGFANSQLNLMSVSDSKVYPSSSKKKHDWDSLAKEADAEKPEGEQALNALFQSIYANASEETRRAMMKSYVESNGTCLSTNWEDVGKRTVDVSPPDGMIARKFEK